MKWKLYLFIKNLYILNLLIGYILYIWIYDKINNIWEL